MRRGPLRGEPNTQRKSLPAQGFIELRGSSSSALRTFCGYAGNGGANKRRAGATGQCESKLPTAKSQEYFLDI
jgi:hypothetical protein